ncbi:TPA: ligand-binding protein SH3, partial [Candidatus Poribacteria bacterium]|nr:ligand-binding protein SH3 [Candidatus Poribacteria bacterium]HEX30369.1 ligand-binding protein SH3 [Candidatus Poribacteria bacterium]
KWLFARTRRRGKSVERYGAVGLSFFVAIPLPVTGAWTGCIAAFLFGIRFKYALPAVIAGVMMAGIVVSILTFGADMALKSF